MKPREKILLLVPLMFAWTGLWMVGPEDPNSTISDGSWIFFGVTHIIAMYFTVKWLSQHVQQRDAKKLKMMLERREQRRHR